LKERLENIFGKNLIAGVYFIDGEKYFTYDDFEKFVTRVNSHNITEKDEVHLCVELFNKILDHGEYVLNKIAGNITVITIILDSPSSFKTVMVHTLRIN
jgi:hypothetical protein